MDVEVAALNVVGMGVVEVGGAETKVGAKEAVVDL